MSFLQSKKPWILLYLLVFLAMLVMSCLTPMLADDYSYSFSFAEFGKRIQSLSDVFQSLAAHRQQINGRMFSHFLAMVFLMLPKLVFNLCNALIAVLQLHLVSLYIRTGKPARDLVLSFIGCLSLWIFVPAFGQVYLWLDGSLNYSWGLTAVLAFLYPFYCAWRERDCRWEKNLLTRSLFVLLAFIAGGYSENASCAGLFMAFCFGVLVYRKQRRVPLWLALAFVSACLGFLYLMTAPAEGGRAAQWELLGIARNIQRLFAAPQERMLVPLCAFAALFALSLLRRVDKSVLIAAGILFLGCAVSIAVFAFAIYFPWRSLYAPTLFLLLSCLLLLGGLWERGLRELAPCVAAVLSMVFLFSFVLGLGDIAVMFMESRQRERAILTALEAGESTAQIHQYSVNTKYSAAYELPDVYEDPTIWPNYDVANYYGIGSVVGLPPVEEFGT